MNDLLPSDAHLWEALDHALRALVRAYGYQMIRTPILEHTALFTRGIGEVTDIVEKEMYSFTDQLNGEQLTLRPENTAAVVRAVIEHNLLYDGPKRLWYSGPMFRHERPQRGRYRQFHQFGVEALGFSGPDSDVEIILMAKRLWDDLGLTNIRLEINSIGQAAERARHRVALIEYFEKHQAMLDGDAKRRLHTNPLRILDSKNSALQSLIEAAPCLLDYLEHESLAHFHAVQEMLTQRGVVFQVNPRLVRGLDYYNLTVFEWITDALGAQGTVCGGGRYDPLIALMGGKPAPACGFAVGLERIVELLREQNPCPEPPQCDVYVAHHSGLANPAVSRLALNLAEDMRSVGLDVILHCHGIQAASFKAQMKKADASGATFAVIVGDEELATQQVMLKALREGTGGLGVQQRVAQNELIATIIDRLVDQQ